MREWHLTASDPMAPRIAADARAGRTRYEDDQVWQLQLGGPEEPAFSLETRYGGRVGLARIVPVWFAGKRQVYETQGYHSPPVLTAFAPDFLRLSADPTLALQVTVEFWVMESQAVGGRFICHNAGSQPQPLRLDLSAQVARENQALQMYFLTLENGQVALQMGRLDALQPVLMLDGAQDLGATARLSRAATLAPDETITFRWVLAGLPDRDASLQRAYHWLNVEDWDTHIASIEARAAAEPQIATGYADWDLALAWSQQLVLRSLMDATGSLPHPSFVGARKTGLGYSVAPIRGGFTHPWAGQSLPDALLVAPLAALVAPEIGQGIVRNFLAVQRDDGWIDARPGLDGQRSNVLAPPLLATLAYRVYTLTQDKAFLAECFDGLFAFFLRWFKTDTDRDGDGVPEWSHPGQGAFADGPTLATGRRWAQGVDLTTIEAPDLVAYLVREARTLLGICKILEREDTAREIKPRFEALKTALDSFWDDARGAYTYRDRDSHVCPNGAVLFQGKGDQTLHERTILSEPGRLILRVTGGLSRKPALSCTLEGVDVEGRPASETIPGSAFDWYRGMGGATTHTVWSAITALAFDGLSRVFKIEASTVDLSRHDQALFMPLWSGVLDSERAARLVSDLTTPERYWRTWGVPGCPATDPAYDPSGQNGPGTLWPAWNARLGWALHEAGFQQESAELFRRVLAAQLHSLSTEKTFRALINPDTGEGLGDAEVIEGAVALDWFTRLFGAFVLGPGAVMICDPCTFTGEAITWTQHGVRIHRDDTGTTITFPAGETVTLPPDASTQIVRVPRPAAPEPDAV